MPRLAALLLFLIASGAFAAPPAPERVAVLANADDPDSLTLARHYLKARSIPEKNLIALRLPREEQITRDTYVATVANPLLRRLVQTGLLEGRELPGADREGRIRFDVTRNGVDFLVLCRGVPLKIANDPTRPVPENTPAPFAVNHASVDSELAVLPRADAPVVGFIQSPWYNNAAPLPTLTRDTLRVARLDGPSATDASRLVDHALEAEKSGLLGRAYVDKGGGPSPKGDEWFTATANLCAQAAFDITTDNAPGVIAQGARFDAPAFYFGWYAPDICGAPAASGFRFPPGAIALHLHSFSARTLRDPNAGWAGPLVARGVTATFGNVEEPYLELTHNPAIFMLGLLRGMTAGEAAAFSCPALSWQTIFIGDPLYRPFLHDVPAQLADLERTRDPALAYAILRAVRRLDTRGERAQADKLLAEAFARLPVLVLAREVLDRSMAAGKTVTFHTAALAPMADDPGLVFETAQKLLDAGLSGEARSLLESRLALGMKTTGLSPELAARLGRSDLIPRPAPPAPEPAR